MVNIEEDMIMATIVARNAEHMPVKQN